MGAHSAGSRSSALLAVVMLGAAACSTSTRSTVPAPRTSPAPSAAPSSTQTPDSEASARTDALRAYFGMMGDWQVAATTADDQSPTLAHHMTGQAFALVVGDISKDKRSGVVVKGQVHISPAIEQVSATDAVVTDCADSTGWLKYSATAGVVAPGQVGGKHHVLAHVAAADGTWRVDKLDVYPIGSCA